MQNARDVLTPDALTMLQVIAEAGSFAAAARQLGLVPSALTYRVRQIEDALDVLLFDRSARQARPTEAGVELLREGARLLQDIDAVAHRVRRVATGWEPQLTLSVDGIISPHTLLELVDAFYAMKPPTRLKLRDGIMTGTLEALTSGRADLAIGVSVASTTWPACSKGCWAMFSSSTWWRPTTRWPPRPSRSPTARCWSTAPWPWPIRPRAVVPPWACWAGRTC